MTRQKYPCEMLCIILSLAPGYSRRMAQYSIMHSERT